MNPQIPCASFLLIPFSNIKKSGDTNAEIPGEVLLLIPFSNIKKRILKNINIPGANFCSSLFQILERYTNES